MKDPIVDVVILCFNEETILPYTLRHYQTFAERIRVFDAFSTDRSRAICKEFGVEVVDWTVKGLNDEDARTIKSRSWDDASTRKYYGGPPEWMIPVDADEIIYFPGGSKWTLNKYEELGVPIVKPYGFEMLSDSLPTGNGQIYDEICYGGIDNKWYAKPVVFRPREIVSIGFEVGCHKCTARLKRGARDVKIGNDYWDPTLPSVPATYLLHYHHIGGLQRIADRYDATRKRLSEINVERRWGNFDSGMKHAQDKREEILRTLQKVI